MAGGPSTQRVPTPLRAVWLVVLLVLTLTACPTQGGADGEDEDRTDWAPAPVEVNGLSVLAESDADGFRLHTASGDKTFLPGINLGSSVPLHQPGEIDVLTDEQYRTWFEQMADLGIRLVRVYTVHPPAFYDELAAHNRDHPEAPLYLVQGAYLPDEGYVEEGRTLYDREITEAFSAELEDLSDAVHGDLSRAPRPGRASGEWTTDVSPWVAAWIVGVEWDPAGVKRTDRQGEAPYSPGEFFVATDDASATERWIATRMDELAAHEAQRGTSAPIAMANWPTTDPLTHPTEPLRSEDLVGVDAAHVLPTDGWPGGTFASFHAYPYYPDFQRYEPGLDEVEWQGEPDRYAGYLRSLQEHFAGLMPLLVTEFGVPSALGSAHAGTNGRGQGGHTEQRAMAIDADMMRMMADLGLGGAFVFSWEDEWFKRTWNTMEHQLDERRQLWHDPLTNEQWFGVVATDPELIPDAAVEDQPAQGPYEYVYTRADASWVYLTAKLRAGLPDRLRLEADVVPGPERADYRVVADLTHGEGTARLEVRRDLDPVRLDTSRRPYVPDQAQPWHLYRLITNREYTRPGREHPAEYQEVGLLRHGHWDPEHPDHDSLATWRADPERRSVYLRIPWSMLGLADPSSRTALGEGVPAELVEIDGIDLLLDVDGDTFEQRFTWPRWNHTTYTPRLKAGADVLADAFGDLAP